MANTSAVVEYPHTSGDSAKHTPLHTLAASRLRIPHTPIHKVKVEVKATRCTAGSPPPRTRNDGRVAGR